MNSSDRARIFRTLVHRLQEVQPKHSRLVTVFVRNFSATFNLVAQLDQSDTGNPYAKFIEDTGVLLDTIDIEVLHSLVDSISVTDKISPEIMKGLATDTISIPAEAVTVDREQSDQDVIGVSDTILRATVTHRDFSVDAVSVTDGVYKDFSKSLAGDSISTSDSLVVDIPPILTSLDYDLADIAAGDTIVITGLRLLNASSCTVGGTSATILNNTNTTLKFTMPVKTAGTYNVQVTTPGGVSNTLSIEAWSPLQITGIDSYFDSRKGVTTSGANVTVWTEQSRNDSSYVSTAGRRPTLVANSFGPYLDRPGVQFTRGGGANDDQDIKGGQRFPGTAYSVFWVATNVGGTPASSTAITSIVVGGTGAPSKHGYVFNSVYKFGYSENDSNLFGTTEPGGSLQFRGLIHDQSSTGSSHESKLFTSAANPVASFNTGGSNPFGNEVHDTIGSDGSGNWGFDGCLGAVIVTSGRISDADRAKLVKWASVGFGAY